MKKACELDVNIFDIAEIYGTGTANAIMSKVLKKIGAEKEDLIITTILIYCRSGPNNSLLSRKRLLEELCSLKQLDLDYVDVVFYHRPDTHTPIDETYRALDWIIEECYAFYWAISEWTADQIDIAMDICEKENLHMPIADQCQYNALFREDFEKNLRHSYENYKKEGSTVWSLFTIEFLTAKYISGEFPEGSRFHPNNKELV
ncbi:unnamed protein product [Moneuplotes crassus]|uniref:NADP-dependent oxidoreductase domain-containing protein n=1 Tax=Euplotes crassus TaxID=5936 RepID=A0AAD1UC20_EUPCR|nr:unnamed protein product [Moneuplotes crassus]